MTQATVPHKIIGVAVIWNDAGKILIDRRKPGGKMGGLWEFPGGKVEPGESIETCVAREVQEELGIEIAVGDSLMAIEHDYTDFKVTLNVHHCQHLSGEPQMIECDAIEWVTPAELDQFTFPEANGVIIKALQQQASPNG
ncbi:8-oxo-dGTP diphosphatase MutT [filamentous cyanobacterium LEGE 11480]|uniref:8-oxo-dGTP diphosphatase n=1 Tax=Romeriopsis navalis LEGE 11480 TaxID=2777977 RepID=A0A928VVK4_9CYAN|nr:8-oxo-dGTP diphosphatase MutT [Romeriopsis navalis]MBE9033385.1 8-oxo-dGTP diphosphatase MutT [Romeriopsis navalis LEGE 11480]